MSILNPVKFVEDGELQIRTPSGDDALIDGLIDRGVLVPVRKAGSFTVFRVHSPNHGFTVNGNTSDRVTPFIASIILELRKLGCEVKAVLTVTKHRRLVYKIHIPVSSHTRSLLKNDFKYANQILNKEDYLE